MMSQGKEFTAIARKLRVGVSTVHTARQHLATKVLDFIGPQILADLQKRAQWQQGILATSAKMACPARAKALIPFSSGSSFWQHTPCIFHFTVGQILRIRPAVEWSLSTISPTLSTLLLIILAYLPGKSHGGRVERVGDKPEHSCCSATSSSGSVSCRCL